MATPWDWLSPDEMAIVDGVLRAVHEGDWARDPRRTLLADRATLAEVAAAWPDPAADIEDTIHVASHALELLAHPIGGPLHTWMQFLVAEPVPVREFWERWSRRMGNGLERRTDADDGASLTPAELALLEDAVRRVAARDLGDLWTVDESFYELVDWDGPQTFRVPDGPVAAWASWVVVFERKAVRVVDVDVMLYGEGPIGLDGPTLEVSIDAVGDVPVWLGGFYLR